MTITGYTVWTISEVDGDVSITNFGPDEAEAAAEFSEMFVDSMMLPVVEVIISA